MSTLLIIGDTHGYDCFSSFGFGCNLGTLDNDSGFVDVVWPCLLGDVGAAMGSSSHTRHFRII